MLGILFCTFTEAGPVAIWAAIFVTAIIAVFVLYVGVALWAALRASEQQQQVRYQVFRDLLDLFRRGKRQ